VNTKDISDFLTGLALLMQKMGAAAQFGLCFLIEAAGIIFHRGNTQHF
jgi:hypothetical protein